MYHDKMHAVPSVIPTWWQQFAPFTILFLQYNNC